MKPSNLLSLFLFPILLLACSNEQKKISFEGDWYVVNHHQVGYQHWKITDKNKIEAFRYETGKAVHYSLIKNDVGQFSLHSNESDHPIDIGTIIAHHENTIEFSSSVFGSGLKMIRLTDKTNSLYSPKQYIDILSNSIWRYEFGDYKTTLYLSDTLNYYGFKSADIIKSGQRNYAETSLSWGIELFNGSFVFSHLVNSSDLATIIINEAEKDKFTGTLFLNAEEFPVTVKQVQPAKNETIESINSILIESNWHTTNSIYLDSDRSKDLYLFMNGFVDLKTIQASSIENNPFTFSFLNDQDLHVFFDGELLERYKWRVSNDGEYIIIKRWRAGPFSANLNNLKDSPPKLVLEMDYYLSDDEEFLIDDNMLITFELEAK